MNCLTIFISMDFKLRQFRKKLSKIWLFTSCSCISQFKPEKYLCICNPPKYQRIHLKIGYLTMFYPENQKKLSKFLLSICLKIIQITIFGNSLVARISACQFHEQRAGDRGSIPRCRAFFT